MKNISDKAIVSEGAYLEEDVTVMPFAVIEEGVWIGHETVVQPFAYIEKNCKISYHSRIGTGAILRPKTMLGSRSVFGNLVVSEGSNTIGNDVTIFSQCHITKGMVIEDNVFMGPMCVTMNTKNISHGRKNVPLKLEPPIIKKYARVGGGTKILPNVVIGTNAFVGAGSVVTKEVPEREIWYGNPAKKFGVVPKEELL